MNDCMKEDAIRFCKVINNNSNEEDIKMYIQFFCARCNNLGCKSPDLKLRKIFKKQDTRRTDVNELH